MLPRGPVHSCALFVVATVLNPLLYLLWVQLNLIAPHPLATAGRQRVNPAVRQRWKLLRRRKLIRHHDAVRTNPAVLHALRVDRRHHDSVAVVPAHQLDPTALRELSRPRQAFWDVVPANARNDAEVFGIAASLRPGR
jgi:hypothetical protein